MVDQADQPAGEAASERRAATSAVLDLGAVQQQQVVTKVVSGLDAEAKQQVVAETAKALAPAQQEQVLANAVAVLDAGTQQQAVANAVGVLGADAQKQLLADTVDKLGASARQELYESLAPQNSKDRMVVYLAGFAAATLIAIGFAVIALLAGDENQGVATAAIAAAASVPSVILGGLMGALTGK